MSDKEKSLAAHRGEVVAYVEEYTVGEGQPYERSFRGLVWADHPANTPGRKFTPLYAAHPPQAQAGAGDAIERLHRYANTESLYPGQKDRLLAIIAALEAKP